MKQNLRRWHKERKDIKKIYVGKTTAKKKTIGAAYDGMQTRADDHEWNMKTNNMKLLYMGSKRNVDKAERELVAYNRKQGRKARNQTGGGGGAPATGGRSHVLYAALKTTKPGNKKRAGKRRRPQ